MAAWGLGFRGLGVQGLGGTLETWYASQLLSPQNLKGLAKRFTTRTA